MQNFELPGIKFRPLKSELNLSKHGMYLCSFKSTQVIFTSGSIFFINKQLNPGTCSYFKNIDYGFKIIF